MTAQQVVVTVNYGENEQMDVGLPLQIPSQELTRGLAQSLGLDSHKGREFYLEILLGTGPVRIPPRLTLAEARVLCGSCLRLIKEKAALGESVDRNACLVDERGTRIPLTGSSLLLGRSDIKRGILVDIDLSAMDSAKSISRRHAMIEVTGQGYFIKDLESTNGTWVNGVRLSGQTPRLLQDTDLVQLGRQGSHLIFRMEENPEGGAPE